MRGWLGCGRRTAAREGGSGTGRASRDDARWLVGMEIGMSLPVASQPSRMSYAAFRLGFEGGWEGALCGTTFISR
jgi:hypothetical protein